MELGVLVAVITVLLAVLGWLVARNHTLNQINATQRDTIDELKRQVDHAKIIEELTEKVLSSIPQPRPRGKR